MYETASLARNTARRTKRKSGSLSQAVRDHLDKCKRKGEMTASDKISIDNAMDAAIARARAAAARRS